MEEYGQEALTERQQFWLDHLRKCAASSGTNKDYAVAHGLSLAALYFWKRQLKDKGILEGAYRDPLRFKKVRLFPVLSPVSGRICFANGITVEWSAQGEEALQAVLRAASGLA